MASRAKLHIDPPLLNSASPWATTYEDLKALYDCAYTGAVTTRTCLLDGFQHDAGVHQYCFFESGGAAGEMVIEGEREGRGKTSLNTLGYSPVKFGKYLEDVLPRVIGGDGVGEKGDLKPVILSVTGSARDVEVMYREIGRVREAEGWVLAMEINLSCPNIHGKPPPAYDGAALAEYLGLLQARKTEQGAGQDLPPVGIKLPPYTYMGQFEEICGAIASAMAGGKSVVDFVTATNTLGSSLVMDAELEPALTSEAGTGIGGLAGAALHPLALGNVATLRRVLDRREETRDVMVIGVGGVADRAGFERMRKVGSGAVALATALGREGVGVFEKIALGKGEGGGCGGCMNGLCDHERNLSFWRRGIVAR